MGEDILCPGCGQNISLRVMAEFDDEEVVIMNIHYDMKCQKCGKQFTTEKRLGRLVPLGD